MGSLPPASVPPVPWRGGCGSSSECLPWPSSVPSLQPSCVTGRRVPGPTGHRANRCHTIPSGLTVGGPPRKARNGLARNSLVQCRLVLCHLVLGSVILDSLAPTGRAAQTASPSTAIPCRTPRPLLTGIMVRLWRARSLSRETSSRGRHPMVPVSHTIWPGESSPTRMSRPMRTPVLHLVVAPVRTLIHTHRRAPARQILDRRIPEHREPEPHRLNNLWHSSCLSANAGVLF